MGWSGWDMPKEHKLRKNKKAFSRRIPQVAFKKRTSGKVSFGGHQTDIPDMASPGVIDWRVEGHKFDRTERIFRICLWGSILLFAGFACFGIFQEYDAFSADKERLALKNKAYLEHRLEQQKHQALELTVESGYRFLAHQDYEDAVIEFEHALSLFPEDPEALRGMAWSRAMICESAGEDCKKALDLLTNYLNEQEDPNLNAHRITVESILSAGL